MATSSTPQPDTASGQEEEIDEFGDDRPQNKRRFKKKVQKKKKTPEIKFDWPKKNYYEVKYGEFDQVVGILCLFLLFRISVQFGKKNSRIHFVFILNFFFFFQKNLLHRMVYIARLREDDSDTDKIAGL